MSEPDYRELFLEAAEILEMFEFPYDADLEESSCWTCGAGQKRGPLIHGPACRLHQLLEIAKQEDNRKW